jgi:hypothetical protein
MPVQIRSSLYPNPRSVSFCCCVIMNDTLALVLSTCGDATGSSMNSIWPESVRPKGLVADRLSAGDPSAPKTFSVPGMTCCSPALHRLATPSGYIG